MAAPNNGGAEPSVYVLLGEMLFYVSNQEGAIMAVKQHTQPFLVSASASALLFHKMHKPLLASLAHMIAQLRALGTVSVSSTVLNRTAGLWLSRDSVIWNTTRL